jgi:hypothetical protein
MRGFPYLLCPKPGFGHGTENLPTDDRGHTSTRRSVVQPEPSLAETRALKVKESRSRISATTKFGPRARGRLVLDLMPPSGLH